MLLDAKNRKILYELDKNARVTYTELARKVGVSKEVARYRHLALEKNGAIGKYFTIIDVSRIGYSNYKAFLKLQNASEKKERELAEYLKKNPNVAWSASCDGAFDVAFGMLAPNLEAYAEKLEDLDNRFGDVILQRDIAPIVRGEDFNRDYLVGKRSGTERAMTFGSVPKNVELDEVDGKILMSLGINARTPVSVLAHRADVSPDAAASRLRRLEKAGIIRNYILVLNNESLGQLHFKVMARLHAATREQRLALVEFCRSHPNIFYTVSRTFGPWEFEFDMEVPNVESFRSVMRNFKEAFADLLRDYSYIQIYRVNKYNFCPKMPVLSER